MCIFCFKKPTQPTPPKPFFNYCLLTTAKRCPLFKGSVSTLVIKDLVGYFSKEISNAGRWSSGLYFCSLPYPIYWKERTWGAERWGWGDDGLYAMSLVC